MIIDAGVHVWRPEAPDRPWMGLRLRLARNQVCA
jgi:predicted TIM-barrel fold metal-dependent hydrolase